jgi:hypothetical protein
MGDGESAHAVADRGTTLIVWARGCTDAAAARAADAMRPLGARRALVLQLAPPCAARHPGSCRCPPVPDAPVAADVVDRVLRACAAAPRVTELYVGVIRFEVVGAGTKRKDYKLQHNFALREWRVALRDTAWWPAAAARLPLCGLTAVTLASCALGRATAAVAAALVACTTLTSLAVHVHWADVRVAHLVPLLSGGTARTLALGVTHCSQQDAARMAGALARNPAVTDLALDHGALAARAAAALGAALRQMPALTALRLQSNPCRYVPAGVVAGALAGCALRTLRVDSYIDLRGRPEVADALACNTTLRRLELGFVEMRDADMRHFAGAIEANTTLRYFGGFNAWPNVHRAAENALFVHYILDALTRNHTLDVLDVSRMWDAPAVEFAPVLSGLVTTYVHTFCNEKVGGERVYEILDRLGKQRHDNYLMNV